MINYAFWSRLEAREYHTAASNCGRTIEIGPTTHACTHNGTLPASVHDTMGGTSAGKHTADVASDMIARDRVMQKWGPSVGVSQACTVDVRSGQPVKCAGKSGGGGPCMCASCHFFLTFLLLSPCDWSDMLGVKFGFLLVGIGCTYIYFSAWLVVYKTLCRRRWITAVSQFSLGLYFH